MSGEPRLSGVINGKSRIGTWQHRAEPALLITNNHYVMLNEDFKKRCHVNPHGFMSLHIPAHHPR